MKDCVLRHSRDGREASIIDLLLPRVSPIAAPSPETGGVGRVDQIFGQPTEL